MFVVEYLVYNPKLKYHSAPVWSLALCICACELAKDMIVSGRRRAAVHVYEPNYTILKAT
jgi:hypothetical protein